MDPSFNFQSFIYFTLMGYSPNLPATGLPAAIINFGDCTGWFDLNLTFFGTASSSSCNPYGIVITPTTDIYPYSNYKLLYENLITGNAWTTGTQSYTGCTRPGVLDSILKIGTGPDEHQTPVQRNVNYYIWFAMNDNDVLANVTLVFTYRTLPNAPPSSVISLTGLFPTGP
jgi:hypothetical protein